MVTVRRTDVEGDWVRGGFSRCAREPKLYVCTRYSAVSSALYGASTGPTANLKAGGRGLNVFEGAQPEGVWGGTSRPAAASRVSHRRPLSADG